MFSQMKFYLHPQVQELTKIREILNKNGGVVIEQSNDMDQDVIYIVDAKEASQNQQELDSLQNRGIRVISTNCVYETVEANKPLPQVNFPLFSRCLEGKVITMDYSLDEIEKNNLIKYVKFMGGDLSETLTYLNNNYLIANRVGSVLYKLAIEDTVTEILRPEWILSCWEGQKLLPTINFKLLPFTGCVISVTGLKSNVRKRIQDLTDRNGGEYSPDLTRKCTHLLCDQPKGLKYTYALDWGVHCVNQEWFYASLSKKCCLDETLYYLPTEMTRRDLYNSNYHELSRLSPALRKKHMTALQRRKFGLNSRHMGLLLITGPSKLRSHLNEDLMDFQSDDSMSVLDDYNRESNQYDNSNNNIRDNFNKIINLCDKIIENYNYLSKNEELKQIIDKQLSTVEKK